MNLGVELSNANRLIEAKQRFAEAVRIAPDFPDAHYNLGVVLLRLGEEAQAGKHFEFVVVSRANFPMSITVPAPIFGVRGRVTRLNLKIAPKEVRLLFFPIGPARCKQRRWLS